MGLVEQAISDIAEITSNNDDWGVSITMTDPDGETVTFNGLTTKHHLGIDEMGQTFRSKKASIAISESILLAANPDYPVRNSAGEVVLANHLVDVKDSTGIVKNYVVNSWLPDEAVGLIVIILEDYAAN